MPPGDACSSSLAQSRSASRHWWRSTPSPTTSAYSVQDQARSLLGADLAHDRAAATASRGRGRARYHQQGRRRRPVCPNFSAMAYVPRTAGTRLVQVTAAEPGYPFYGEIGDRTAGMPGRSCRTGPRVVVEPALLTQLAARVGDTLSLGEGRFTIIGVTTTSPATSAFAPPSARGCSFPARMLDATRLLGFGARAEYARRTSGCQPTRMPSSSPSSYRSTLRPERVRIRTVEDDRNNLTETLDRLGNYLGLVALIALLLGGLGVASAVSVFIRRKLDSIAVLRCLGATSGQVFSVYLLQAAGMGLLGSVVGVLGGIVSPAGVCRCSCATSFRSPSSSTPSPRCHRARPARGTLGQHDLRAAAAAVGATGAAARRAPARRRSGTVARAIPLTIPALAAARAQRRRTHAPAGGQLADGALVLAWRLRGAVGGALAHELGCSLARCAAGARRDWPYVWRQGLANLHRPANQTTTVVLALGFGAFLLATLYLVQHNLLRQLRALGWSRPAQPRRCSTSSPTSSHRPSRCSRPISSRSWVRCRSCRCASRAINGKPVLRTGDDSVDVDSVPPDGAAQPGRRRHADAAPDGRCGASTGRPIATPSSRRRSWLRASGGAAPKPRARRAVRRHLDRGGPRLRTGRDAGRHDHVGRAGTAGRHADHEHARGRLGALRAQLLRGVRAWRPGEGTTERAAADTSR